MGINTIVMLLTGVLLTGLAGTAIAQDANVVPKMPRGPELGWKGHPIRVGDGRGGWKYKQGELQFLHVRTGKAAVFGEVKAFGLAQMDNGEVLFLGSWNNNKTEVPIIAFSKDQGDTWSDWHLIPGVSGRPMMLAYLGKGDLTFQTGDRYYSHDYGRTWTDKVTIQLSSNGRFWGVEGNPLVEFNSEGEVTRMAEIGYNYPPGSYPVEPSDAFIRWSNDRGRTWVDESQPAAWKWQDTYENKTYKRSISEGSLVRAKNGWLIAALRLDMPAKWIASSNDNMEGIAVSISKDDGKTWSPMKTIYRAGRMHPHLLRTRNGDLVMTYVMRQDAAPDGESYASYRRGCGAVVSKDNGLTWDVSRQYALDEFEFATAEEGIMALACGHTFSCLLDDGRILTAYSNYPTGAVVLIRWKP